ncbi:MAG: hypothetical protein ABR511_03275, partial [Acidimicrobiales bacterium]
MAYVAFPSVGAAPDGSPCLVAEELPFQPPPAPPEVQAEADREWAKFLAQYPLCPGDSAMPPTPPVVYAFQAWKQAPLPSPAPYIAPGWGITGKDAYVETRGRLTDSFTAPTPIGTLTMAA